MIQAIRRRAARECAAYGGHGRVDGGRRFVLFGSFAGLDGEGTAKDINFERRTGITLGAARGRVISQEIGL